MTDVQRVAILLITMFIGVAIGVLLPHGINESDLDDSHESGKLDGWQIVQSQTIIGLYKYDGAYYIHQPGIGIIKLYSQNQTNALTELITEANGMKNAPNGANVMVINGVLNS